MIEIHTGGIGKVYVTTYDENGLPVEPDANPIVHIKDAETGEELLSSIASLVSSNYPGDYEFVLPQFCLSCDRIFTVTWSYTVESREINIVEYLYVSTPYATVDELIKELGFSSRPEDANYFPYERIKSAERTARMMIDTELGFSLGKKQGSVVAYGTGADVLLLPSRIISIDSMSQNDEVVIDYSNNFNSFGYDIEITETDYGVRIRPNSPGQDIKESYTFDITGMTRNAFKDGWRYEVSGIIGWKYIPVEIKQCVFLLVNDLLCNESSWRSKYVKKITTAQTSIETSSLSFSGTGNAIVDSILHKFKMVQAVII